MSDVYTVTKAPAMGEGILTAINRDARLFKFWIALLRAFNPLESATPREVFEIVTRLYKEHVVERGLIHVPMNLQDVYAAVLPPPAAEQAWQLQVAQFQAGEMPRPTDPENPGRPQPML